MNPSIMVVDDEPTNLKLLEEMLGVKGYEVRSFPRGQLALASALQNPPDLILLDVNMPQMSGYEVCERMKCDSRLSEVPILFLSALNDTEDKVKAFRAGGVDFISKPFHFKEVYARVETHLKLHELQRALKLHNEQLEATVDLRTRELADAHAMLSVLDRAKNDFLRVISHEFRTPLNGLLGICEIVLSQLSPSQENDDLSRMFDHSRGRILSLLDDALLLTQIDVDVEGTFKTDLLSLSAVVDHAIEMTAEFARSRRVSLPPTSSFGALGLIRGHEGLLVRGLSALIETAVTFSDEGGHVQILCEAIPNAPMIFIESCGQVPKQVMDGLFRVFSTSEATTEGKKLGLAPSVASRILSLFGGTARVTTLDPSGMRLVVKFELQSEA